MKTFRFLALIFSLFLLVIVLAANTGVADSLFSRFYAVPYADKTGHFLLYGILALLISLGFRPLRARLLGLPILRSSLLLSAVAFIEEFSQRFFPSRSPDALDLIAGLLGIFLFGELGAWIWRLFPGLADPVPGPFNRHD